MFRVWVSLNLWIARDVGIGSRAGGVHLHRQRWGHIPDVSRLPLAHTSQ
jgi:hypothetical protein